MTSRMMNLPLFNRPSLNNRDHASTEELGIQINSTNNSARDVVTNDDDTMPDSAVTTRRRRLGDTNLMLQSQSGNEDNVVAADDDDDDDGDDDVTIIGNEDTQTGLLDFWDTDGGNNTNNTPAAWTAEADAANEERRRNAIRREIERMQRTNFIHFVLLCLVPTSLLLIVIASVLGENDDCSGSPTSCANEPRTFINAFTTRCICDAVTVSP